MIGLTLLGVLSGCATWSGDTPRVAVPGPESLKVDVPLGHSIELELPTGEATVVAGAIDHVDIAVTVRCPEDSSRCRKKASRAELVSTISSDRTRFSLDGSLGSGAEVTSQVRVPEDRVLDVRMKYGTLTVQDHAADLDVRMTAGDVDIVSTESEIGAVELNASVGEASLRSNDGRADGRRPLLVGSKVEWYGVGQNAVNAHVRFGDVQLRLQP
ncbi:MAG: hypothetical protein AAFV47_04675 [Pseudomonadota bacterium]